MNSNKKGQKRLNDNLLQAKSFLEKEIIKKGEQKQKVVSFFEHQSIEKLFETTGSILSSDSSIPQDFTYYKLNLECLKTHGIHLELIDSDVISPYPHEKMEYVEYYLNVKSSYIILVKYYFKHIRLLSADNKTDLNTFVFINSKSSIYYYDIYSDCQLIKQFETNMDVSNAKEIFAKKSFKVFPSEERTYYITSSKNSEQYEEKSLKDIHLIPKQLLDILLEQYENSVVPEESEIKIETHFLGISSKPIPIQTKVLVHYDYSGIVQTTENLLEYEIVLYFSNNPEKKVQAKFYLSEAEKNQTLILTEEYWKNAILEELDEDIEQKFSHLNYLTIKYLIKQNFRDDEEKTPQKDIAKMIFQNTTIKNSLLDVPFLKDTFERIYIETFKISSENFMKNYSFNQIRENKIECCGGSLLQSSMYSIVYKNTLYLVEVFSKYVAYKYENNPCITIYLPAFSLYEININIFKPTEVNDIDEFISRNLEQNSLNNFVRYHFPIRITHWKIWNEIFPDFDIVVGENKNYYEITNIDTNAIYKNIFNCISGPEKVTSTFYFSTQHFFMGYDEDDEPRFPISHNGLIYGYYINDGSRQMTINSSFEENAKDSWTSVNDLLYFRISFAQTTLYDLLKNSYRVEKIESLFNKCELFDHCIEFILDSQDKILPN